MDGESAPAAEPAATSAATSARPSHDGGSHRPPSVPLATNPREALALSLRRLEELSSVPATTTAAAATTPTSRRMPSQRIESPSMAGHLSCSRKASVAHAAQAAYLSERARAPIKWEWREPLKSEWDPHSVLAKDRRYSLDTARAWLDDQLRTKSTLQLGARPAARASILSQDSRERRRNKRFLREPRAAASAGTAASPRCSLRDQATTDASPGAHAERGIGRLNGALEALAAWELRDGRGTTESATATSTAAAAVALAASHEWRMRREEEQARALAVRSFDEAVALHKSGMRLHVQTDALASAQELIGPLEEASLGTGVSTTSRHACCFSLAAAPEPTSAASASAHPANDEQAPLYGASTNTGNAVRFVGTETPPTRPRRTHPLAWSGVLAHASSIQCICCERRLPESLLHPRSVAVESVRRQRLDWNAPPPHAAMGADYVRVCKTCFTSIRSRHERSRVHGDAGEVADASAPVTPCIDHARGGWLRDLSRCR